MSCYKNYEDCVRFPCCVFIIFVTQYSEHSVYTQYYLYVYFSCKTIMTLCFIDVFIK